MFLSVLLFLAIKADTFIVFDFTHILKDQVRSDTARGQIYKGDTLFYISVEYPLKQVIYFSADTMIVNYPESKRAFKVKSSITFKFQTPGGPVGKTGSNLKKAGFMFLKREIDGNRKSEIWIHPKTKLKLIYTFEGEHLLEMASLSEKGDTLIKVSYGDYQRIRDKELPMTLRITSPDYQEIYKLSNPRFVPFTDSLRSYLEVGKDTKVEYKGFEK